MSRTLWFLLSRWALACILCLACCGAASAASRRVLYLGDSMSMGAFGTTLDRYLRNAGLEVYTVVTGGATPYYWLSEFETIPCDIGHWVKSPTSDKRVKVIRQVPKVEDLMKLYDPDIVIVQTGANLYSTLRSKRTTAAQGQATVESLVANMCYAITSTGRRVYWVTPPDSHCQRFPRDLQEQMRGIMKRVAGRYGRVFDSYAVTKFIDPYPETDGIHYGPTEASAWALKVAADFGPYASTGRGSSRRQLTAQETKQKEESVTVRRAKIAEPSHNRPVEVVMQLASKSEFTTPSEITYRSAFAVYEYKVLRVVRGSYPSGKIRVAHTVVWDRKIISSNRNRKIGEVVQLELVPLSNYPQVKQTFQEIDNLPVDLSLEIYIPKM